MTDTRRILHPKGWADPRGYVDGVEAPCGRMIFLAGQIGWNPATAEFESDDFVVQAKQALINIRTLLAEASAEPRHLVRLAWYVVSREEYSAARRDLGTAYREVFGAVYPPMSVVVVAGLIEPRAKVEIEATALVNVT